MTIAVVGGGGQLGRALARAGAIAIPRAACDVTDAAAVATLLDRLTPRVVVNAAALAAVDRAEREPAAAFAVNAVGAALVARACAARGVRCVYVSTDHVFAGTADRPYREDDDVAPVNHYGASKAAGERAVIAAGGTVVRTSWLVAPDGWGFAPSIVRAAQAGQPLRVVADQWGRPTPVDDLAAALLAIAELPVATYHVAGAGVTTWHGLASALVEALGLRVPVEAISTADWATVAPRPRAAILATDRAEALGVAMPPWCDGVTRAAIALAARALDSRRSDAV